MGKHSSYQVIPVCVIGKLPGDAIILPTNDVRSAPDGRGSPYPDASGPCSGHPCGVMVRPPDDAGDASDLAPDAVSDAEIAPDDVAHCGGVCGVIVHLDQ